MERAKHKPKDVLRQFLICPPEEIPEFEEECVHETKERMKLVMTQLRNHMKEQKEAESKRSQNKDGGEQQKLWRRIKTGLLIDEYARMKRFLLIYMDQRYSRIDSHFWKYGADIKESQKAHITVNEKKYLLKQHCHRRRYKTLVQEYCAKTLDITKDLYPPMQSVAEVRVINNCGSILDENSETINLTEGSVHNLPIKLIERFILQGNIEVLR